jgi:hypothetical protein
LTSAELLAEWAEFARKVGWVPTRREYLREGSHGYIVFRSRFQRWVEVPKEFCRFAASGGLTGDWTDVLEKIKHGPIPRSGGGKRVMRLREAMKQELMRVGAMNAAEPTARDTKLAEQGGREENRARGQMIPALLMGMQWVTATILGLVWVVYRVRRVGMPDGGVHVCAARCACGRRRKLECLTPSSADNLPLLGEPIRAPGMVHAPVNEMGVMLLFAMVAAQLGMVVESVRAAFPDCLAKIEVEPGRWQYLRIEFEYESRAFQEHGHDPQQCDMIVCWKHNWKGCPPNLQVLELSRIVGLGR